jgi:hypothetical protein
MTLPYPLVFLAEVDNTLLDNEQIQQDLRDHFEFIVWPASRVRYWQILEDLFGVLGCRDYIAALERYRIQYQREVERASLCSFLMFLMNYPFAERLCPGALEVLKRLRDFGPTVLLLEGDTVFQPRKIGRAGLVDAIEGRVSKVKEIVVAGDAIIIRHSIPATSSSPAGGQPTSTRPGQPVGEACYLLRSGSNPTALREALLAGGFQHNLQEMQDAPLSPTAGHAGHCQVGSQVKVENSRFPWNGNHNDRAFLMVGMPAYPFCASNRADL